MNLFLLAISISSFVDAYYEDKNNLLIGTKYFLAIVSLFPVLDIFFKAIRRPEVLINLTIRQTISFFFSDYFTILHNKDEDKFNFIDKILYHFDCCEDDGSLNYRLVKGKLIKDDYNIITNSMYQPDDEKDFIDPLLYEDDMLKYTDLSGYSRIGLNVDNDNIYIRV